MHWKGANRLYSRQSLELWSERLGPDWEEAFGREALKQGRILYKRGVVREISLNEEDAIMTCKLGKQESYSVVEWTGDRLQVRSSCADGALGQAIAVAGLLEIEELLADEDLSLLMADPSADEAPEESSSAELPPGGTVPPAAPRMLHLVLDTRRKGLICKAYWLEADGSRVSALGLEDGAPRANGAEERGRLILLASRARKSHFSFSSEFGGYLLENLREAVFFAQSVWPGWSRWFSTEEGKNVARLREGVSEISIGAKVSRTASGALDVKWLFNAGRRLLTQEAADALLEAGDQATLIPEIGVARLSLESRSLLRSWRERVDEAGGQGAPYQLFSLFAEEGAAIELSEELREWRDGLLADDGPEPKHYLSCLRPYQVAGVAWMSRLLRHDCHGLLADEMGLGKTLQVIALLEAELKPGQRALVVCPASVVPVWLEEFAKFAPRFRVGRFEGRGNADTGSPLDVAVVSYALVRTRLDRLLKEKFEYAIIDEAQFIKNPDAKTTQSCLKLKANRRIALTGTPIENKPLDIWPAFQFLMPGLLGPRSTFERRAAENPGLFNALLKAQIAPFMLRRTKSQVATELPEKVIVDLSCPVTPLQAREYARLCEEGLARFGDDLGQALRTNRFGALSLITRLRQASCDPQLLPWIEAPLEESGKLMVLLEKLIEVLGTGHKVVIFSQFVRFLKRARLMVETSFPELPVFELTGSTLDRETPVRAFQECKQTAAMLVSLRAASVGITLHSADYVFLLDPWWNPAVESQAIDRVHRIGQTNSVFVYRLFAQGTIEERIHALQREKRELFDTIVADSGNGLDVLAEGVESLRDLLTLR